MSRRSSSLNRIDSGISRHLGNQYAEVLKVANNIDAVVKAASVDLEALALALEEATDFEGISVVSGSVAGWDPVTKVITVPTIKGDTGEDLSIVSIEDDGNGVFTWNFSDGTVFQTPSLTGPRGLQGVQGPQGEKGDFVALVNVTHQGNGIFKWTFDDGSSYTTPSLTGPQGLKGDKGDKGDKGEDLTIEQIVSNADGTFVWQFSDGTTYTTPNLKGSQGPKGEQGNKGEQGVSVHHLRPTNTTDPEGDYGTFGELDTYTFYGDADETIVLGWFTVRNGISSAELEPLGIMRTTTYDKNFNGIVDNSEKLEGASLSDVHSFVTDRTGDTSLLNTTSTNLADAVNEVRSTLNNLDGHVTSEVTRLDQRVDTEQSERKQDVLTLNTRVGTEVSTLNTRIDTEVSTLNTRVDTEVAALDNDIQGLTQTLSTETATRTADVAGLNGRIDTVESAAVQESLDINTRITNEVSTLNTRVDTEVNTLNTRITSEVSDINSDLSALTADKYDKTGGHISGDVSISGKLTVQGGMAEVEAEHVSTSDTVIRLNEGEVGAGVTNGFAGVEIDRGTETDYEFGFNETTKLFEVGKVGDRQPLLTRMLSPVANKFFRWNDTAKQAETADVTWGDVTGKLSDVSKTEAEAGTATTTRFWSSLRVREAILGWWNSSTSKTKLDGIETGAQVNVGTNLGQGGSGDARTITSSTGNNVTISTATTSNAGFMSTGDKTKLDGIQSGAQVNSVTSVAGKTGAVTLAKGDVGLGNVDNVQQAPITRAIIAGTGLSGGGDLTADRTVALGTPGTLNGSTTNAVTAESHTHEISDATETVAGVVEKATNAEAKEGTANKFPDAAGVHASFGQYGLGTFAKNVGTNFTILDSPLTPNGFYEVVFNGWTNSPTVGSEFRLIQIRHNNNAGFATQIAFPFNANSMYMRQTRNSLTFGEWVKIQTTGNGATDTEVQAGTDTEKWISPAALSSRTATETRTGLVEKATAAEAIAGTVDKFPDAAGVLAAFNQYGLGTAGGARTRLTNLNTHNTAGFFLYENGAVGAPTSLSGFLIHQDFNVAGYWSQTTFESSANKSYHRQSIAGAVSPWVEIQHTGNGATNTEVQAGTNTEKWISPAALSSRTATDTRTGLVELATNNEAKTGTDTARAVTSAGVHAAFGQYGLGSKGASLGNNVDFNSEAAFIDGSWKLEVGAVNGPSWDTRYSQLRVTRGHGDTINQTVYGYYNNRIASRSGSITEGNPHDIRNKSWVDLQTTDNGATTAEAEAGTDTTKWVSPAGVHAAFKQYGLGSTPNEQFGPDLNAGFPQETKVFKWTTGTANSPYVAGEGLYIARTAGLFDGHRLLFGFSVNRAWLQARSQGTDTWSPPVELYHTGNTLGTVSQSGGVPTGAIIERGSNANGEYVRFADGTQICTRTALIDLTERSSPQFFTFPASFTSSNHPIVTNICDFDGFAPASSLESNAGAAASITISPNRNTNSRWIVVVNQSGGTITNRQMYLSAIGRWY